MSDTIRIRVLPDETFGTMSPRLYGHFAEHLGRCCYDGLWVGPESDIPNENGFRTDAIQALAEMPCKLLRWPGGCYADHYHWRDGIGANRPQRLGMSCGERTLDTNALGLHEFLWLCERVGAEPYLAGNMGSGSCQEMCDFVEYTNATLASDLVQERTANGRAEPWDVRLWGVGNENWGCGGHYDPESYGLEYRRYATMLRHVDDQLELVSCGFEADWNRRLMHTLRNHLHLVDHLSIHRYWGSSQSDFDFDSDGYYGLLKEANRTEQFVQETRSLIQEVAGTQKKIGIALDEWGAWHPEAKLAAKYEQRSTLRDAIAAAVALEGFHRQSGSLTLANLAQVCNVLHAPIQTHGEHLWMTPTYYVFQMHRPHLGGVAHRVAWECEDASPGLPKVGAMATRKDDEWTVSLTNRHMEQPAEIIMEGVPELIQGRFLAGATAYAMNGPFESEVLPNALHWAETGDGSVVFGLPPHSVTTIRYRASE